MRKFNLIKIGKISRRAAVGTAFAIAAVFATVMPGGEAQAIGNLRERTVYYYNQVREGVGLYSSTVVYKPITSSRQVSCWNDPGGYRNIYIDRYYIAPQNQYYNEANFRVRYYPNWPSTAGNFVDDSGGQYGWHKLSSTFNASIHDYRAIGTCVIAGTYYRVETDRRVSFRVYD